MRVTGTLRSNLEIKPSAKAKFNPNFDWRKKRKFSSNLTRAAKKSNLNKPFQIDLNADGAVIGARDIAQDKRVF